MSPVLPAADPAELGLDPARLERACELIAEHVAAGRHPGAQLAVARRGRLALFRCFGTADVAAGTAVREDTLFLLYSNTKVVTAAALWSLVEDGRIRFGDAVAEHLPDFAAYGKGAITVEQVLTHQAGFPTVPADDPAWWNDHARLRRLVCEFQPEWPAGSRVRYHPVTGLLVVAALIEAMTGQDFRNVVRERIIEPCGLAGSLFLGLPEAEHGRAAVLYEPPRDDRWTPREPENTAAFKQAGIPGGGGYGTAAAMAAFYQMLAAGGVLGGRRILSPRMIDFATRDHTGERLDEYMGIPMHRGLGPFSRGFGIATRGLGTIAQSGTFGHGGVGSSYCWADPASGVSCAFVSNCRQSDDWHNRRMDLISNVVHAAIIG